MNNRIWKRGVLGTLAVCGLLLAGCSGGGQTEDSGSGEKSAPKQEISIVLPAEMGSADVSLATDMYSFTTLNNVYEGLYRLDKNNEPELAGAGEMGKFSDDNLTYTVKLREDAKWSNGDPVTADDYIFSWQRTVDPKTASDYSYMLAPVKNATAISEGKMDKSKLGVEAVNDHELKITLEKPTPYFESLLAFPTFFPQSQKEAEKLGDKYASNSDNSVYNGPFTLEKFDGAGTDTSWVLQKNSKYWDADTVKLKAINFSVVKETSTALNLFEDGQANDVTLTGELAMQKANDKAYVAEPSSTTQYLEMNQAKADSPFRSKNLRMAISYAMDRKQIVDKILGNGSLVATGLVPKDMSFNPDTKADFVEDSGTKLDFDADKAKEYWEKAKKDLGVSSLEINLLTSDAEQSKKLGEYIQGTLEQTFDGMKVTLSNVPLSVRLDRSNSGNFEMVMNNWIADYADPSNFLELFTSDSSYNRGKWLNDEYDSYVEKAGNADASDPTARWKDMVKAAQVLNDDMGIVPLFQNAEAHLRSTNLKGVIVHGAGAAYDYKYAYLK